MATPKQLERAETLYGMLADSDQTYETIQAETEWSRSQIIKAVQVLRDILAENGDVISVVCDPQGASLPWVYGLRAGNQILDVDQSRWAVNRLDDAERRLKTISHVLDAAVQATDGRSVKGRKARIYKLHLKRAEEEIAMLSNDGLVE